jgi:uncharacterized protein YllA (UPF0747 family)
LENGIYKTVSGNVLCKESQIEDFCREKISDISPNAALRPLYQEIILPNIAYIGVQAELKYWAQLKETFEFNQEKLSVFIPRTHNIITKNLPSHINIEDWFKSDKEFLEIIDQNYQNKMQQFQNCLAQVKDDLTRLEKHSEDLVKGFNASIKIDKIQDKIIDFEQTILKFSVSQNTLDTEQKKLLKVKNTFFNREKIQEREYSVLTYVQSIKTIYDCINIKGYKSANELKTVHNVEINISNILN